MKTYGMKEACEAVGMRYETLKFYCNQGLVPNVKRDGGNRRREMLRERMEELAQCLAYIDGKQRYYDDVEAGRVKYASNLLPREEDA